MIDEKQVQEADAAIAEAVSAFVSEFEEFAVGKMGKRDAAHLIANRGPPTSAGQGIVSAWPERTQSRPGCERPTPLPLTTAADRNLRDPPLTMRTASAVGWLLR